MKVNMLICIGSGDREMMSDGEGSSEWIQFLMKSIEQSVKTGITPNLETSF